MEIYKVDSQTVGRPYWDNPAVTIYRSEYDEKTHRALDRYGKTDEYYKRTGCGEFIQDGTTLVLDWKVRTIDDLYKFFGFEKDERLDGKRVTGFHLKVCFDHYGRLLMFHRDLGYEPKQFIKKSKTRTRTWATWTPEYSQFWMRQKVKKGEMSEYTTWGWSFKRPEDFLIFHISPWKLNTIIPEHNLCWLDMKEEDCETLWNTGITDLSKSWVTPESEAEVERIWRIRQQRNR